MSGKADTVGKRIVVIQNDLYKLTRKYRNTNKIAQIGHDKPAKITSVLF